MESRAGHFLAAKKISEIGSSMGNKDEILGSSFGAWHFAFSGTRTGQMGVCVDKPNSKIASGMMYRINLVR